MLEILPVRASIVRCFGDAKALKAFPSLGTTPGRVASDELWLIGPPDAGGEIALRATAYLAGADPDGLVVDHGEGWAVWSLSGAGTRSAFARVADFPLPREPHGFVQGAVAQVPAKIIVGKDRLHLIVPVQLAHHVPERIMEACGDLSPSIGTEQDLVVERQE